MTETELKPQKTSSEPHVLAISKPVEHTDLLDICSKPATAIMETEEALLITNTPPGKKRPETNKFHIDMISATAYSLDLAGLIVHRLQTALELPGDRLSAIQTALHEAVANAILHGNLELGSISNSVDVDNINQFLDDVEERLSMERYGERRIKVAAVWNDRRLEIQIEDEGRGFDFKSVLWFRRGSNHSVRGIGIIDELSDELEYSHSGRKLALSFDLAPD